jgi:transmembrane sensor
LERASAAIMAEREMPDGIPRSDKMMREASTWFARMRGPDADTYRADFDHWLSLEASHRGAYNEAGEIFAMGRFLASEQAKQSFKANDNGTPVRRWSRVAAAAAFTIAIGGASWLSMLHHRDGNHSATQIALQRSAGLPVVWQHFATDNRARRSIKLADGSVVELEADSTLSTQFSPDKRELRLEQGRARFNVAHDGRTFTVLAGGGSVTARGTIFDVILGPDKHVTVHLLRGVVDVVPPEQGKAPGEQAPVTRLSPGDSLRFASVVSPSPVHSLPQFDIERATPVPRPAVIREFDQTPLSALVTETNSYSTSSIRLADPYIGALRVSGRFRIDDPNQVAERLANLFDLEMIKSKGGVITLRRH